MNHHCVNPSLPDRGPVEVTEEHEIAAEALVRGHWLSNPAHREWMGCRTSVRWADLERACAIEVADHGPAIARYNLKSRIEYYAEVY